MDRRDFLKKTVTLSALGAVSTFAAPFEASSNRKNDSMTKQYLVLPDYPIIDAHMHPYLASDRNFAYHVPENYDEFFSVQASAGIQFSCGSFNIYNGAKDLEKLRECNRRVLETQQKYPEQYYPGVNVSPLFPEESCREIEKFHKMGFRWVGELAWYFMGYEKYNLPGMKQILDLAGDLDMPVCLHPSTLEDLDSLLSSFRKTKMVIAHPESPWGISAMYQFAAKHDNMLLDLSGSGLFRMGMLRKGVDVMGSERILFGTDYPICNPAMNVAGVLFENLTEKEKKHILHDNFLRLIGKNIG